jgi:eukaryotic-like serine/threonine-protein kinase
MKKPTVFGKYLLLERLNVGGMAEVFTAKAFGVEGFERILAIKKILPTMAEDEEFITMFIDEARISVQLNHANVVHIHELGKHDDAYYIAMEYVSGKDLRALLERFRRRREIMPTAMAVFVASKMCEGLDYAHRKKDARGQELHIIHRDVSPQNILISYEGEVKIIDFGIAKAANRSQKTQAGILKGKFGYMSPEQVRGQPIDRRSDIFAVGVTLYEMLTGEKLFVGESDFSTLEKVRNAEVPLPRQFNPNIPAGLEKVVLKSLAREVEDRYQWSSDLQEDLMRFLLAGDAIYSAKHLSAFMKEAFAEDLYREAEKMERYASVSKPEDLENSGVTAAPKKKAPTPPAPPPPAPPSGARSKSSQAAVSVASGAGALAMGPQNATLNIPPPSAEELAEMDGTADRTIIMPSETAPKPTAQAQAEVDLKTAVGLKSPYSDKSAPPAAAANRAQLRPSTGRTTGNVGNATTHDNLSPGALSALSQDARAIDSTEPPHSVKDDDTNNDLKPIEMTGFRPALEVDEDGNEVPPPEDINATMAPMSRPSRPKVVIGDAPVNGATTVGPSPLSINETLAPASTRAFEVPEGDEDGHQQGDGEGLEQHESTAERPALKPERRRATPAPRPGQRRAPAPRGQPRSSSQKKPGVMIAIGALAVVAVLVVGAAVYKLAGSAKGKLGIVAKPEVAFTVNIGGKSFDHTEAIELDPGKYTGLLQPRVAGYAKQTIEVEIVAGKMKQVTVPMKPEAAEPPEAQKPDPVPTAPIDLGTQDPVKTEPARTAPPKTDPAKTEPAKTEPAKTEPAKTEPAKAEAPKPWSVTVTSNEANVEITLDGQVRGQTPEVRVSDLTPGKTYRGIARKSGFISETFTVENKANEPSVSVDVVLKPESVKEPPKKDPPPVIKKDPPAVVKKDPPPPPPPRDPPPPKASAAKGKLMKVNSNPVGAEVFVDGKSTGRKTPILPKEPLELSAGKHKLTFKLGGKMSPPVEVVVTEGENSTLIRGEIPQ